MPSLAAALLVFFTSAAVLVLEILAGRLLAPYVGVTLETFTGIIGVVLAGIALGSWYGGKLADARDPRAMLGPTTVLGGVLALFALPLVTFFGVAFAGGGVVAILVLSFAGFFAPAAVLSAVTPMVIKLQLASLEETGTVVGRLSALSTVGAIFGTFVTGFVLVATLPSRPILITVGVALIGTGLVLWRGLSRPDAVGTPAKGVALGVVGLLLTGAAPGPCGVESAYYCASVLVDPDRPSGRLLRLDRLSHSYVDLDDPTHLEFTYTQMLADVLATVEPGEPLDVLHVGGGGFTMPRYLEAVRPGSTSLVLELDPTLLEIAEDDLGFRESAAMEVEIGDARLALDRQPDDVYDLVIGDAFGGVAVPWHLTTREVVEQIRRTLRPGGVYALNVIDYPPLAFARAEAATLRDVFAHVAVLALPERLAGQEGGNVILVGSDAPIDAAGIAASVEARGDEQVLAAGPDADAFIGDARVLTDDFAPVDQLLTPFG